MKACENLVCRCGRRLPEMFLAMLLTAVLGLAGHADAQAVGDVDKLLGEFDTEVAAKVTPAYDKALADVNAKYKEALNTALARATKGGKLESALPMQKDLERLEKSEPIPDNDEGAPPELKKLRENYREEKKRAARDRDLKLTPIVAKYDRSMESLQAALTKAGKLEDALEVKKSRDFIKQKAGNAAPGATPVGKAPGRISRVKITPEVPAAGADGWIVLYEEGRLYGCSPELDDIRADKIAQQDGCLRLDRVTVKFNVKAKDLEMRVMAKKVSGNNFTLSFRFQDDGLAYSAWFNGGNNFGVGRMVRGKFENMVSTAEGPAVNDFFEFKLTAEGNAMQSYVNGKKQFDFRNGEITEPGKVGIMALNGVSLFRKIEVRVVK